MEQSKKIKPDEVEGKPYIFISYSRKDDETVQEILQILRKNHIRFWYDLGLKSGEEWAEELGERIDKCEQFMVLMSPNSVESKYVRKEIGMAVDCKTDGSINVLYLEQTTLTSGLKLFLNNVQAIHKEQYSNIEELEKVICESVPSNVFIQENAGDVTLSADGARVELEQHFEIMKTIGKGGFYNVFLARHRRTGNYAAIKYGRIDNTFRGKVILDSFVNERDVLSKLFNASCPYVPMLLDCFADGESVYLAENYVEGFSLERKQEYSEEKVVQIAKKVLTILKYLHGNNIIYRDLKPGNIIEKENGDIYLIDFNTARVFEKVEEPEIALGTVGFAPPEQFVKDGSCHTTFASDIYALGRTMVCLLCQDKFERKQDAPIRYYRQDVSAELEKIIDKMTEKEQNKRYQSAQEVLEALENYKQNGNHTMLFWESEKRRKAYQQEEANRQEMWIKQIKDLANTEILKEDVTEILANPDDPDQIGSGFYDTCILFEEN